MDTKLVRALLTLVIAIVVTVENPTPMRAATAGCTPDMGKRTPVILVHGWGSSGSLWGSTNDTTTKGTAAVMASAIYNLLPNMYIDIFDYSSTAREWVDNPNIGFLLAQRIASLAATSRACGGLGKVIAIGHSMGGLAIRYAAAQTVNGRPVSQDIGFVVTIATPNIGSGWANLASTELPFLCRPEDQLYQPKIPPNSICNIDALNGLKNNSQKINELPWLPSSIPLLAIAGDVTITYPFFFATIKKDTGADLFVSKKSALQGMAHPEAGGGQFVISCTVSASDLDLLAHSFVDTVAPSCSHTVLPHNEDVVVATVNAIKKYLNYLTSPCQPSAGICLGVHSGDVDGDGKPDQVGVTYLRGTCSYLGCTFTDLTIHVALATGQRIDYVVPVCSEVVDGCQDLTNPQFLGLSNLDGNGADEIVLTYADCVDGCGYWAFELRSGQIKLMPFYGGMESQNGLDGLAGEGGRRFKCTINNGVHTVTILILSGAPGPQYAEVYQPDGNGGMRYTNRFLVADAATEGLSGVNCPGLSLTG